MIVRKILEYTEECTTEKYILIADKYDEGWELDREEMHKLVDIIERSLEAEKKSTMFNPTGTVLFSGVKSQINSEFIDAETGDLVLNPYLKIDKDEDNAEECPDKIEPPEIITETDYAIWSGDFTATVTAERTCDEINALDLKLEKPKEDPESYEYLTKSEDKSKETNKANFRMPKKGKNPARDFTKYIGMFIAGINQKEIIDAVATECEVTEATATNYYYSRIKPKAEKEIQESKVFIVDEDEPEPGKFFSRSERERIQKEVGIK